MTQKKYRLTQKRIGQLSALCKTLVMENPNLGVPWYLMSSWAYYEQDKPFLDDATFDWLAKFMLENWNDINHFHKDKITKEDLFAGTLLKRDFVDRTKHGAVHLMYYKELK